MTMIYFYTMCQGYTLFHVLILQHNNVAHKAEQHTFVQFS